jgi:hypothetical protein
MTNSDGIQIEHIATMPSRKAYYKKSVSGPTLDQVSVVCEYPNVFPEELPRMPPDQDIEFIIELIPGTTPIAQTAYRMNTQELEELKNHRKVTRVLKGSSAGWDEKKYLGFQLTREVCYGIMAAYASLASMS